MASDADMSAAALKRRMSALDRQYKPVAEALKKARWRLEIDPKNKDYAAAVEKLMKQETALRGEILAIRRVIDKMRKGSDDVISPTTMGVSAD